MNKLRLIVGLSLLVASPSVRGGDPPADARLVRCAVIGGMMATGLFTALARRYEAATGDRIAVVASGNKDVLTDAFRRGGVDLVTMHASDAIINLVADGWAEDPQPWARNDHVLIGPVEDPAHVRGLTDAGEAMRRIVAAHAPFVVPHGTGAQEMLREVCRQAGVQLDETAALHAPEGPDIALVARARHAYTLVGRIPFTDGKMETEGLAVLVEGDARLRRPYVVAIASARRFPGAHHAAAARLSRFLRDPATQKWLAEYGRASNAPPPFFPIAAP
jgi:tungstate transport system substrate-binding protein